MTRFSHILHYVLECKDQEKRYMEVFMDEHMDHRVHKLSFLNRGVGLITGVKEVRSFNEEEIILDTDMGLLSIRGTELHVTKLNLEKGEVEVDGTVDSLVYTNTGGHKESGSLFGKLFK